MASYAARRIGGIVFDLDGTLTLQGAISFAAMRQRTGCPPDQKDVLAHIAAAPPHAQPALHAIVVEEEEAGLARMRLAHDAGDVLEALAAAGVRRALLTRNNDSAMRRTVDLLSAATGRRPDEMFDAMLCRDFTPTKPHPAPLLHLCAAWGLPPHRVVMVGDTIDDVATGRAAGAVTVLVGADPACPHYVEALPHAQFTASSLTGLLRVLERLEAGDGGLGDVTPAAEG